MLCCAYARTLSGIRMTSCGEQWAVVLVLPNGLLDVYYRR